jgi:predicted nucleic acid-binding protein
MKESAAWEHTFWGDHYSITEAAWVNPEALTSHGQVADVYLAALALRHGGKLATFDRSVAWQCVPGATSDLVEVIGK